jgi:bifunctional DNA-binding transcriptional regulator/antitoxin component of YhaV-PrlF toxin-antitoxin module
MVIKITSKRQVTFPARVLAALGVQAGDSLELHEGPAGYSCFTFMNI